MAPRIRSLLFGEDTVRLELLQTRVCDLGVRLRGTRLGDCVAQVRRELRAHGFRLRPKFFLSDGYGCVAGTGNIGVGFWDADERLRRLNWEFRGFLWSWREIVHVLRHEVGHAFCYTYRLYRRRDFRDLFGVRGNFFRTYPRTRRFHPNPRSRDYVNPWGDHYAQRHPDEDFAETFAEWLSWKTWRRKYRHRPGALRKLEFVDRVVRELARHPPAAWNRDDLDGPVEELRMTLREFFRASTRKYRRRAQGYVDRELQSLFPARMNGRPMVPVAELFLRHRARIESRVARAARADRAVVRNLAEKVRARAQVLRLAVRRDEQAGALVGLTALLTTLATRYELLGRLR